MTNKGVKLYKFDNHTTSADKIATAKGTDGAIIWIVDLRELWVGNSNAAEAKLILKGAIDVSLNNDTLTITHYNTDGTTTTGTLQFEEVADGLIKDGTPSYTAGHYVIENGKLVSASGKSSGDTYTISANDGYTKASDVKAYVDSSVDNLKNEVINDEKVITKAIINITNSVGLESDDLSFDLSTDQTGIISNDDNIKGALLDLADAIDGAGQVNDVKIDNVSILSNKVANIVTEEVADGLVKDGTPSYTSGHYVIENSKLVSAVGKSTGDTYTISSNDGMVKASDAKAYVDALEQKVLSNERVSQEAVKTLCNSSGFENDFSLDLSDDTTGIISNDDNIKGALLDLADAIDGAGQVNDVKIDNVSILSNKVANIVTEEVADGLIKDGTPSYTSGHYVIENGKLVSAVGKSTGDTYTISQNDGLTKASDVKAYVDALEKEVIDNEEIVEQTFSHISDSIGLENDLTIDFSDDTTGIIDNDTTVKDALLSLADAIDGSTPISDMKMNIDVATTSSSTYAWSVSSIENRTYRYITYTGSATAVTVTPSITSGYDHYLLFFNNSSSSVDITLGTITVLNNGSSSTASVIKKPATISVASGKCVELSILGFVNSSTTYAILTAGGEIG